MNLEVSGKKTPRKHKLFGAEFPQTFLTLTPGCPGFKIGREKKRYQQLKQGVFGKGSFRNLCAELCFVFFCVLR